jgi:hypothetical protein
MGGKTSLNAFQPTPRFIITTILPVGKKGEAASYSYRSYSCIIL